ncbi:MAG TPA: hypothetical protein VFY10_09200, partial [Dehalococcoidia bacterium]|nr:hypothetical protein [Dehalococcoidia bacterium]
AWQDIQVRLPALIGLTACCSLLVSVHVYRQDLVLLALAVVCGVVQAKQSGGSLRVWYGVAALVWLAQYLGPDLLLHHGVNVQTPALVLVTIALAWQARPSAMVRSASIHVIEPETSQRLAA